jgi:hypothetical protein
LIPMPDKRFPLDVHFSAPPGPRRATTSHSSLTARLVARLRYAKYDHALAVGVRPTAGSPLAAHALRLTSVAEREAVARTLRRALDDSRDGVLFSARIPLHIPNITAAEDLIDAITLRLHSPRPVSARGMARLRRLLSDGGGPFYRLGRGDLQGRLGAALAAL